MRRASRGPIDLHDVYRTLVRRRGHAGWWPAAERVRGLRRRHPGPEHGLDERREGALPCCARAASSRYEALGSLSAAEIAPAHPARPAASTSRRGGCAAFLDFLGRSTADGSRRWRRRSRGSCARSCWPCPASGRRPRIRSRSTPPGRRLFVIDAYTRRVFSRLGAIRGDEPYDVLQRLFMDALPAEARALRRLPRADRAAGEGRLPGGRPARLPPGRPVPQGRSRRSGPSQGADRPRVGGSLTRAGVLQWMSWGRHGFDGNNDPGRCRRSVLPAPKSGGKSQLPTITWLWLPNLTVR